jgi:hypothetical protein
MECKIIYRLLKVDMLRNTKYVVKVIGLFLPSGSDGQRIEEEKLFLYSLPIDGLHNCNS